MSNVIRWNPFRELAAMQSAMDRMFDDAWRTGSGTVTGSYNLPIDVHETEDAYTLMANIPGLNPDQITVNLHDNVLTIAVEIPELTVEEGTRVLLSERFTGKMTRRFTLPQTINEGAVEANYDAGVLTLTLPKAEEVKPRQIQVKTGGLLQSNN